MNLKSNKPIFEIDLRIRYRTRTVRITLADLLRWLLPVFVGVARLVFEYRRARP